MLRINENLKLAEDILYFDNDDAFYKFAVVPQLVVMETTDANGNPINYTDFNFSKEYNDAIANGTRFIIKDEDSQIYKRGCVSYRTVTKDVKNLDEYFEDL